MRFLRCLSSFLCVVAHVLACVLVGLYGGLHRFHVMLLIVFSGLCLNVGSSQWLMGEPSIRCAR